MISGVVDLHVHGGPSLIPRHAADPQMVAMHRDAGAEVVVLKAHEGSTAERAALCGPDVLGGIVLNSPVGGANPSAVETSAGLGGRVVWMPTTSAANHQRTACSEELSIHRHLTFRLVPVVDDDRLREEWFEVLEVCAQHDLVLASGHLSARETLVLFGEARRLGVTRLLVNHPLLPFQEWDDELIPAFARLDAHLELGILADLVQPPGGRLSKELTRAYPSSLLVFGSDLGHADYPTLDDVLGSWVDELSRHTGEARALDVLQTNGRALLGID